MGKNNYQYLARYLVIILILIVACCGVRFVKEGFNINIGVPGAGGGVGAGVGEGDTSYWIDALGGNQYRIFNDVHLLYTTKGYSFRDFTLVPQVRGQHKSAEVKIAKEFTQDHHYYIINYNCYAVKLLYQNKRQFGTIFFSLSPDRDDMTVKVTENDNGDMVYTLQHSPIATVSRDSGGRYKMDIIPQHRNDAPVFLASFVVFHTLRQLI